MAKKRNKKQRERLLQRVQDARPWLKVSDSAAGELTIALDVHELPRPDRSVAADCLAFGLDADEAVLVFGQSLPGSNHVSAALVVRISPDALAETVHRSGDFFEKLSNWVEGHGDHRPEISKLSDLRYVEGAKTLLERASVLLASYWGRDGEIWMYQTSPHELQRVRARRGADLAHPVIAIQLSTARLRALFAQLRKELPPPSDSGEG